MLVTTAPVAPLGVPPAHLTTALRDGARLVDVRSQADRDRDGVLRGAIALDPGIVLDRLSPGSRIALRSACADARWVIVATDGHDAEWITWHLHARGVHRARFLIGGVGALAASGRRGADRRGAPVLTLSAQDRRDLELIAAH